MTSKKPPLKRARESIDKTLELPDVALAAIAPYKKQKDVNDFISFLLEALERNSNWLNNIFGKQNNFRCALMTGAGPNRFQIQELIYPSGDNDIKLEVEHKDSEDYDNIAFAALIKLSNPGMEQLLKYIKIHLSENRMLKDDLLKGNALGVSFAVLRPFTETQYRVVERIVIGSSMKSVLSAKKRKDFNELLNGPPVKRSKKLFA